VSNEVVVSAVAGDEGDTATTDLADGDRAGRRPARGVDIDHLESVVSHNRALRSDEVEAAAALVETQARDYLAQAGGGRAALLTRVSTYFADVVAAEEARLAGKLVVKDRDQLRYGLERVGNKLQHQLLRWLREHPDDPEAERMVRELLGL